MNKLPDQHAQTITLCDRETENLVVCTSVARLNYIKPFRNQPTHPINTTLNLHSKFTGTPQSYKIFLDLWLRIVILL